MKLKAVLIRVAIVIIGILTIIFSLDMHARTEYLEIAFVITGVAVIIWGYFAKERIKDVCTATRTILCTPH